MTFLTAPPLGASTQHTAVKRLGLAAAWHEFCLSDPESCPSEVEMKTRQGQILLNPPAEAEKFSFAAFPVTGVAISWQLAGGDGGFEFTCPSKTAEAIISVTLRKPYAA